MITTFKEYSKRALKCAKYPQIGKNYIYPTLGLAGEAGEIANKVKKLVRDKGSILTVSDADNLAAELGDVLWYIAAMAMELGWTLDDIATYNINKLEDRLNRGVIQGSGDNR